MANNTRSKLPKNNDTTSDPLGVDICIGSPAPAPSSRRRQLSAPVKMPANTDSAFKIPANIDPALFEAIKLAVQVAMQEHNAKMLERMDKIVADVSNLNRKYDNIEKAIQDCSGRLDAVAEQKGRGSQHSPSNQGTRHGPAPPEVELDCPRPEWRGGRVRRGYSKEMRRPGQKVPQSI